MQQTTHLLLFIVLLSTSSWVLFPALGDDYPAPYQERLKSAFPTEEEITSGLDLISGPEIRMEDKSDANYYYVIYNWEGYRRFFCPSGIKDGRIDTEDPGDWYNLDIWLYRLNTPASQTTLSSEESFRENIRERVEPFIEYPDLPGGMIMESYQTTDNGIQTNIDNRIAFRVDENVYGEVKVSAHVRLWSLYDKYGCQPSSSVREKEMKTLANSEVKRISSLVYERLTGTDTIPPDTELVNKKEIAQDRLRYARDIRDDYEKHWNNVVLKEVTGGVFGDVNLFDAQYSASNPLKIPTLDDTLKGSFLSLWTNGLDRMQTAWEREEYDEVVSVYEQTYNEQREIVKSLLGGESKSESDPSSEKEDPKPLSLESALVSQKTHLYHDAPISE